MTQREVVVRLCEAYIKAGQTVEICQIIKIADYIMTNTCDSQYTCDSLYSYGGNLIRAIPGSGTDILCDSKLNVDKDEDASETNISLKL